MCMSCGCNQPYNDHNDYNNITYNKLLLAMVAGNVPDMATLIENMEESYEEMQGQSDSGSADSGVSNDIGPTGTASPSY